jgi:uncharacterized membrane protein
MSEEHAPSRLFYYVAILLGGMPPAAERDTAGAEAHVIRTTRLFEAAGRQFQPRTARVLFRARRSRWFVSPRVLLRHRHLAQAIRLRRLEGDARRVNPFKKQNPSA